MAEIGKALVSRPSARWSHTAASLANPALCRGFAYPYYGVSYSFPAYDYGYDYPAYGYL